MKNFKRNLFRKQPTGYQVTMYSWPLEKECKIWNALGSVWMETIKNCFLQIWLFFENNHSAFDYQFIVGKK